MMSSISASIVNMLYNFQLMKYVGNSGVAAYGVIMYVNFIFVAVFIGYSIGVAPIVGYHYGAGNHPELKNLFRKSLVIIGSSGVVITALAILLSPELASNIRALQPRTDRADPARTCYLFLRIHLHRFQYIRIGGLHRTPTTVLFRRSFRSCERFSSRRRSVDASSDILRSSHRIWFAIIVAEFCCLVLTTIFIVKNRSKYKYY